MTKSVVVLLLLEGVGHHLLGDEDVAEDLRLRFELARDGELRPRLRLAQQAEGVADREAVFVGEVVGDDRFVVAPGCAASPARPAPIRVRSLLRCSASARSTFTVWPPESADPALRRCGSSPPTSRRALSRRRSAAPAGIGEKPSEFSITRPPAKFSSITWATELFSPAAKTVMKVTSARAIISAAAVTAVRPGLRFEFSRASRPVSRAHPLQRPAGEVGERPHQERAEERDGDDHGEPAAADPRRPRPPIAPPPTSPATTKATPIAASEPGEHQQGDPAAPARRRREGVQRGDRRHPGRAPGGDQRREEGDDEGDERRETITVRASITRPVVGRSAPNAAKSACSPSATTKPPASPTIRADQPDRRRFEQHRGEDLPARGAERPQHAELRDPLGDRDREGVEDDEGADQHRDVAEDEQDRLQEAEVFADFFGAAVGAFLRRLDPRRERQHFFDPPFQRRLGDARLGGDRDLVELPALVGERAGRPAASPGRSRRRRRRPGRAGSARPA